MTFGRLFGDLQVHDRLADCANLGAILENFETILVPEMNSGQLSMLIQAKYLRKVVPFSKMQGRPFTIKEILIKIEELSG